MAVGRTIASTGREVVVLEAESAIGVHTSSRNSEVIHAGIYYPTGSMKAKLCVRGNVQLYEYCRERGIEHRRIGKLIVAITNDDIQVLSSYQEQAARNGVGDLRWLDAGAERYLLRIESSNPDLYRQLHPENHSFESRVRCLRELKDLGYQMGTGVMIGLPGQELEDLAKDILFFKEIDADMIGMGPYLHHGKTPMGMKHGEPDRDRQLSLGLKMLAATRVHLRNVNLAATTALEALVSNGKELGIHAGANVVMPNLTDRFYRGEYCLYEGKPGTESNATQSLEHLSAEIERSGCEIGWGEWGDAPHFALQQDRDSVLCDPVVAI